MHHWLLEGLNALPFFTILQPRQPSLSSHPLLALFPVSAPPLHYKTNLSPIPVFPWLLPSHFHSILINLYFNHLLPTASCHYSSFPHSLSPFSQRFPPLHALTPLLPSLSPFALFLPPPPPYEVLILLFHPLRFVYF